MDQFFQLKLDRYEVTCGEEVTGTLAVRGWPDPMATARLVVVYLMINHRKHGPMAHHAPWLLDWGWPLFGLGLLAFLWKIRR